MRRWPFVALIVAALMLAAMLFGLRERTGHPPAASRDDARTVPQAARNAAAQPSPAHLTLPALEMTHIDSDPRRAATEWFARADAVVVAKRVRDYGAAAAALAALPPAQAWPELVRLSKQGDAGAAAAAADLANECERLREQRSSQALYSQPAQPFKHTWPPPWDRFAAAMQAEETSRREARTDSCAGIGGVLDFATMAIDRFVRPDNPDAQLWEAAHVESDAEAIPLLRDLAARMGTEDAQRVLGERLFASRDPSESAEGLAMLVSLAETDQAAAEILVSCYLSGCGSVPADPVQAQLWMQAAAGLGNQVSAIMLNNALSDAHDNASGWAWAMYEFDLAASGCLESAQARASTLLQNARRALDWDHLLAPSQRAQAQELLQALRARWLARAASSLHCEL